MSAESPAIPTPTVAPEPETPQGEVQGEVALQSIVVETPTSTTEHVETHEKDHEMLRQEEKFRQQLKQVEDLGTSDLSRLNRDPASQAKVHNRQFNRLKRLDVTLFRLRGLKAAYFFSWFFIFLLVFAIIVREETVSEDEDETAWETALLIIAVAGGSFSAWLASRKFEATLPKSCREIFHYFFKGFPRGTVMVSYCWADDVVIPRKVAKYFPCSWLDIENLLPGSAVKESCRNAAKAAKFRVVFASQRYFKSVNCGVEWEQINKEPGCSFIMCYPDIPETQREEMRAAGHFVFDLASANKMSLAWVFSRMISHGIVLYLFDFHSPAINDSWEGTATYLGKGKFNWSEVSSLFPSMFFALYLIASSIWVLSDVRAAASAILLIIFSCGTIIPAIIFIVHLSQTGVLADTTDAGALLIVLNQLSVIKKLKVFDNRPNPNEEKFQPIAQVASTRAIELIRTGDPETIRADVSIVCIDSVPDNFHPPQDLSHCIYWAEKGFMGLSPNLQNSLRNSIISTGAPNAEELFCAMLMKALNCEMSELTIGSRGFNTLDLEDTVAEAATTALVSFKKMITSATADNKV
eukprot:TRINITY_DN1624_c0_g1::TRINITY_DN1624_c0_g1_i1::g.17847::m.17847 TRINITY_DN1624_c0_g1::TRINITY_DN1624_c0_g1_i1::g.17847  ORF type:complete len:580 (-),score=196.72,TIR_2/PF13676.1/6.9e-05,DUF1294/PF06961.8/0.27,OppC_N/PF12911.2/0.074,OppC_N/PF12911.2/1e+04 TRINITY_DN1624_c0_g1_i1:197-1936(-)